MEIGDIVIAEIRSGTYIGELVSADGPKAKVRVLAVLKHPAQGDLHHPMQTDVAMFHQRRALSHREVANVPLGLVKSYEGVEVPEYRESLRKALQAEKAALKALGTSYAQRALVELEKLEKEYF